MSSGRLLIICSSSWRKPRALGHMRLNFLSVIAIAFLTTEPHLMLNLDAKCQTTSHPRFQALRLWFELQLLSGLLPKLFFVQVYALRAVKRVSTAW